LIELPIGSSLADWLVP